MKKREVLVPRLTESTQNGVIEGELVILLLYEIEQLKKETSNKGRNGVDSFTSYMSMKKFHFQIVFLKEITFLGFPAIGDRWGRSTDSRDSTRTRRKVDESMRQFPPFFSKPVQALLTKPNLEKKYISLRRSRFASIRSCLLTPLLHRGIQEESPYEAWPRKSWPQSYSKQVRR